MPPKRGAGRGGGAAADGGAKRSKLAKENNISAVQEGDIREVFSLFAEPRKGEKEGVIPTADVRRAMIALNIPPTPPELAEFVSILDPEDEGFADYSSFVAICALKMHQQAEDQDQEAHEQEVDEAFRLFLTPPASGAPSKGSHGADYSREGSSALGGSRGGGDSWISNASSQAGGGDREKVITIANLKRIAAILKEDVDDQLLRDMILEANGGAGVGRGVKKDEFEVVMRKAGVWR